MQAQIRDSDRVVVQHGQGLGARPDHSILDLTEQAYADLLTALEAPNGGVVIAPNGSLTTLEPAPETIVYAGQDIREGHVQTVGTASQEVLRFPITTLTAYSAVVEVFGIDNGNGAVKSLAFRSTFKRLANGPAAVGTRTDISSQQDSGPPATTAGVANWAITPALAGNDAVISVTGHTGRTVDWFAFATIRRFRPGGLS